MYIDLFLEKRYIKKYFRFFRPAEGSENKKRKLVFIFYKGQISSFFVLNGAFCSRILLSRVFGRSYTL